MSIFDDDDDGSDLFSKPSVKSKPKIVRKKSLFDEDEEEDLSLPKSNKKQPLVNNAKPVDIFGNSDIEITKNDKNLISKTPTKVSVDKQNESQTKINKQQQKISTKPSQSNTNDKTSKTKICLLYTSPSPRD